MFCQIRKTRVKILNHISNRRLRRMTSCPPSNHPHQNPAHRPSPAPTRRVTINPAKMKDRYSQRVPRLAGPPNPNPAQYESPPQGVEERIPGAARS